MLKIKQTRKTLLEILQAALQAVNGKSAVYKKLQHEDMHENCSLIAIGKAAQAMTLGAIDALGSKIEDGLVISKPGHLEHERLEQYGLVGIEGEHPLPGEKSLQAGRQLLAYLDRLPVDRQLLFLISGGTSSLVDVLRDGIGLDDLRRVNNWLLASGLGIGSMNRVRKALSVIKGGGLLNYTGTRKINALMISDVPEDNPAVIGSGLLSPGENEGAELAALQLPGWLMGLLPDRSPAQPHTHNLEISIVANLREARNAAARRAEELGYKTQLNQAFISSEAETAGRRMALEMLDALPGVYIWGGEPSVELPENPGRGGRNQHLALAAATVIEGREDICFLSAGTDGTDGPGDDAGAIVDGGTLSRANRDGFDAGDALARADAGTLLAATGDLINTGPTGTNVMDLMIGIKMDLEGAVDG